MYTLHASAINASFTGVSSIGPYTKTAAPQILPAVSFNSNELLSVSVGKATNVTFVSDGSGSYTLDNTMATGSGAGGGGNSGGMLSPGLMIALLTGLWLRISAVRRATDSL